MTYNKHACSPVHRAFSYNPEAAEPKDTDEQWTNGKLSCSWCDEIIPGGKTYFDIPGQGILCESCARINSDTKRPTTMTIERKHAHTPQTRGSCPRGIQKKGGARAD